GAPALCDGSHPRRRSSRADAAAWSDSCANQRGFFSSWPCAHFTSIRASAASPPSPFARRTSCFTSLSVSAVLTARARKRRWLTSANACTFGKSFLPAAPNFDSRTNAIPSRSTSASSAFWNCSSDEWARLTAGSAHQFLFQRRLVSPVIEHFGSQEVDAHRAAPDAHFEAVRAPGGVVVAQDRHADHGAAVAVVDAVAVDEHALGQGLLLLALPLDVDQQPRFMAVFPPHFEELVGQPTPDMGVVDDLLEFLVGALVAAPSVDGLMDAGEEERQEGVEEVLQGLLPRVVQL